MCLHIQAVRTPTRRDQAAAIIAMAASPRAHALLLPFPETGHINPLMELAKHLASHGILITFVNTQYNHSRILRSNTAHLPSDLGLPIRLVHIPDGLSDDDNRDNDLVVLINIIQNVGPALEDLVDRLAVEGPPITCIISDVTAPQTLDVAKKLGVPRVCFWPNSTSLYAVTCHALHGASHGSFPRNGIPEPDGIVRFPGLPAFPGFKAPWLLGSKEKSEALFRLERVWLDALRQSEWVLCNSVHELETYELPPGFPPLCPVGPILLPHILEKMRAPDIRITTSLWVEESTCLHWLDAQKPHSVMYVSVGSIATLKKEQLQELAYGLESTDLPILWVVRDDITGTKGCALPEGFLDRTQERIRVVAWAPQLRVLSHVGVGGFLTHCGWNSTIEAMSMGVPMLVWPQFTDQFWTASLVVGQWGVGLELNGGDEAFVGREMVEKQARKLMEGSGGSVMRGKALEIRQLILEASREGGSTHKNMQNFVSWLKQQADIH